MAEKTFRVEYLLSVPGIAIVCAKDAEEARRKMESWDVVEHHDYTLDEDIRVGEIEEVKV